MDPVKVIKLRRPIEFGKEVIEELSFRRGRLGDLKGIKLDGTLAMDDVLEIAARLTGRPRPLIERIDQEDAGEVTEHVLGFYMGCLVTGSARSAS